MNNIHPTAIVYPNVILADGITIGPYCIIGSPAEVKRNYGKESPYSVFISPNATITGMVTIDAGTVRNTHIMENCFIMKHVHIGHDAIIGYNTVISPHAVIGGHVMINNDNNIGMGAIIHQRCYIPEGCMIGMGAIITKKTELIPKSKYVGNPARFLSFNE